MITLSAEQKALAGTEGREKQYLNTNNRDIYSEAASYGRADDIRLFDMVNAATYVAQSRPAFETEMIERMAGDLLTQETHRR